MGISAEKTVLRHRILEMRDNLDLSGVEAKSLKITESIIALPEFAKAQTIACYVNKGSEVQTRLLIRKALAAQKKILVPITRKDDPELLFSEIPSLYELSPGPFGIMEPNPSKRKPRDVSISDMIIVPGIVFDVYGHRIGWGRGYYDRALKKLWKGAASVGVCFDMQLVDQIPMEQFDLPVKILVTESRVIRFSA